MQVMERALVHFPGAVIVVSHDRYFIEKVATRVVRLSGDGTTTETRDVWSLGSPVPVLTRDELSPASRR